MKDEDIEGIADAINEFVHDSVEPLSQGLSEVVKRVDEIHARPIPENGRDGIDGKDGVDGQDGAKGDTGEKGVDGVGLDAPVYESGVYREGSIVQAHFGQVYKAVRDTSEGVDSEDWERVGTSGFRLTGTFDAEKEYVAGDLFIKGFGLFLHDGAEARLIAGRGPEGKKGEKGAAGKDGKDGQDGKDGATFDALEIKGTNLVAVIRSEEGLQEHAVDLAPFLEATVEVTKSVSEAHTDEAIKALDNQFKSLWETFQQHLTDQQATPVRFFRGGYTPSVTYQAGDLVNFSQSLYVAKQASTGILPHGQLAKDVKSGDYWAMLTSGGGGGGGGGGSTDLSEYVKRPTPGKRTGQWLTYREQPGGVGREWEVLTTDLVETNPSIMFRDSKGRFAPTPDELDNLTDQLKVNRFFWECLQDLDSRPGGDSGGSNGGILWEEIDTGSNQNPILTLRSTGSRPTGSATEGILTLWHLDPADCTTNPNQELKVWMTDGGQSILDKWNDDGVGFWFEIRQGSKSQKMKLVGYPWVTNTTTSTAPLRTFRAMCWRITKSASYSSATTLLRTS